MSRVFLVEASAADGPFTLGAKADRLFRRLGFPDPIAKGSMVAVKVHLGEGERPAPILPAWIRPVVQRIERHGAQPFLTDTCTLYRGGRSNAVIHLRMAAERGFTPREAGAPFVVADGLLGEASVTVPIGGRHFSSVEIAAVAARAQALVCFSHFTGHMGTSFGAALKNLGMGLAARAGKLQQHAGSKPRIDQEVCTACGACLEVCQVEAIGICDGSAVIAPDRCTGCGQCITVCYQEGIKADYGAGTRLLQERIAEHALGAVWGKEGLCAYLTFLLNVTRNCDCLDRKERPLFDDIGILASVDPVAIDQAACDLVLERTGRPIHDHCERDLDPDYQLAHAAALGLGQRRYQLQVLSRE